MKVRAKFRLGWKAMAIIFALVASSASLGLYKLNPSFLEYIDNRANDAVFELRADEDVLTLRKVPTPPFGILTVVVDEKAVKQYGRWPWPRELHARLIRKLKDIGVRTIGLDIVYLQDSDEQADLRLIEALKAPGATVVGGYFFREEEGIDLSPEAITWFKKQAVGTLIESPGSDRSNVSAFKKVESNAALFGRHLQGQGFFNTKIDRDGLVRRSPLILRYEDDFYPSLALLTLSKHLGEPIALKLDATGIGEVRLGKRRIPVNGNGELPLNFYNTSDLLQVSAADVLSGQVSTDYFDDSIVFIGVTEVGIADVRPTPVDNSFPGVLVHSTLVGNILQERYLKKNTNTKIAELTTMGLAPLLMILIMARFRSSIVISIIFLFASASVFSVNYWLLAHQNMNVSFVYPGVSLMLGFFLFQTFHMLVHQRHSRFLRRAFSAYISPSLVDILIKHPDTLTLTGEKRTITVLFSDIRGFTTLSESVTPEKLVLILNKYLGPMTDIVMANKGTLDKYIGDAVMAIYNAPLDVVDHAEKAAGSALEMMRKLDELNVAFQRDFQHSIKIGIGLHTGEAVVGNMGSEQRFNYTAIGDTVNLASRLEARTKAYGVPILISGKTRYALSGGFVCRRMDRLRVKGKAKPVEIFELMGYGEEDRRHHNLIDRFQHGLAQYFDNHFNAALKEFEALAHDYPDDKPTQVFIQRCRDFIQTPPPEDWGGVYVAEDK